MTHNKPNKNKDPDLSKVEPALRRAAKRAKKIAQQTGTPFITFEKGHIVRTFITEADVDKEDSASK